jgi:hypothetical protein
VNQFTKASHEQVTLALLLFFSLSVQKFAECSTLHNGLTQVLSGLYKNKNSFGFKKSFVFNICDFETSKFDGTDSQNGQYFTTTFQKIAVPS